ncbi:MAG: AAA family ATPase, partial [Dehalococcoidia bacterium]|nr:AAA family ATPase [Dehalococcoidia bacterium]
LASYDQQRRELNSEIESLSTSVLAESEALTAAKDRLSTLVRESGSEKDHVLVSQGEIDNKNTKQAELQAQYSKFQEQSLSSASVLADIHNRRRQLAEREAKLSADANKLKTEDGRLQATIAEKLGLATELQGRLEICTGDLSALTAERDRVVVTRRETHGRIKEIEAKVGEAQREATRLQSQCETLSKLQDSYTGLYTGVKTVLQAAKGQGSGDRGRGTGVSGWGTDSRPLSPVPRPPDLAGVIGIVASLIEVPKDLEIAVEVALGGHLQDIVVERWAHAEDAIEFLKRTKGGRATFLPLDSMRGGSPTGRRTAVQGVPGVIGIASDLVKYDTRLTRIMEQMLGQTIIVENLIVARKVMEGMVSSGQIVTLAGEIVRPNGSLTGGATRTQTEGAMLFRVRGLRELPEQIRQVLARQGDLEKSLGIERDRERTIDARLTEMEGLERKLSQNKRGLEDDEAKSRRLLDRFRQEAEFQSRLSHQAATERTEVESKRRELLGKQAEAEKAGEAARRRQDDQRQRMEAFLAERARDQEGFNELRTRVAVMDKAIESERILMANHHLGLRRQEAQKEAKLERREALLAETSQLDAEVAFLGREKVDIERQLEALDTCIEPALSRLTELDTEETVLLHEESALKAKVLTAERQLVQANSVAQRCGEDLANLRERMEAEGIDLVPEGSPFAEGPGPGGQPWQLSPGMTSKVVIATEAYSSGSLQVVVDVGHGSNAGETNLPAEPSAQIAADPIVMKRRIDRLRGQLRSIGPINASVIDEYEETQSRHDFLDAQIRDLTESEKSLREGIAILDTEAKKRFDEAFETLGREFKRFFAQLFGGGTAKLVRADENEGGGGIDIIAQPPGKRLQSLSLLSGGERALTATALLFAILKVNPAPFCLLDEVDAALDESNVGRFVGALKQLSENTQFIVITHNRGTVEVADTLYGISMNSDGASKMVSLKLEEGAAIEVA